MTTTDQIRKVTTIRAPQAKVWSALSVPENFGYWFGSRIEGSFTPGERLKMTIEPTKVDAEVAKEQEAYKGIEFDAWVEDVTPQSRFAFRWQPYALDEGIDPADAPCTLVEFLLEPVADGTQLTIIESGFDNIPLDRRARAFANNERGWGMQIELLTKYAEALV